MIVLDTNVFSEAMKPSPEPAVARWIMRERGSDLYTTAVSEADREIAAQSVRMILGLQFQPWLQRGYQA